MKKLVAIVMALLIPWAMAEPAEETVMEQETVHAFVEALFLAVTGTEHEAEAVLREGMTWAEIVERNEKCADYRSRTLPWLLATLDVAPEEISEEPTAEPTPEPEPDPDAELLWTIEDSYAAFTGNEAGISYLELLSELGGGDMEKDLAITREICEMWMLEIDHEMLYEMNEDYVCWLYAPGTQIDYPVVHGEDNSYYLKRMFNGESNAAGTLFVDYRNLSEFRDPNTLIYGHHMRNDSMFGTLTDYDEQAYYESHPYMIIMDAEKVYLAELFAGYTTDKRDHCYDIAISDEEDMLEFLDEAREKSDFLSSVEVDAKDSLVTFSTCAYAFENARYILIGRLVEAGYYSFSEADE